MSKLVICADGARALVKTPLFAAAAIYRIGPGFAERYMGWLYELFGGKRTLESGRYIIRWSKAQFTLEVK
ncbi:MAG: hypothetical protein HPY55_16085 [Firmicutes bacterium]|nr:hypothetical protein [Bacillota bacterium]